MTATHCLRDVALGWVLCGCGPDATNDKVTDGLTPHCEDQCTPSWYLHSGGESDADADADGDADTDADTDTALHTASSTGHTGVAHSGRSRRGAP